MKVFIGWVPIGDDCEPYRPIKGSGFRARKKPTTLYQSREYAEGVSPVGKAAPCYMGESRKRQEDPK